MKIDSMLFSVTGCASDLIPLISFGISALLIRKMGVYELDKIGDLEFYGSK
jgi:hypothetical protein